ncbi:MAG: DUF3784 domain-containing protein [Cytophagaceae bacterium]|jgi:hypothetical protein|nr:DUF3784 domain-containing protein [Cytophagaceae bacterium]
MESIDIINWGLGVFYIVMGFAIYAFPNLIAGYNTMSKNEKESFDIVPFKKLMRNTFIVSGIIVLIASILFWTLNVRIEIKIIPMVIIPLALTVYLLIAAHKYQK